MEEQNYYATLGNDAENEEDGDQPSSPTRREPSAQRRSGPLQRLSPSTRQVLAARAARSATLQAGTISPSYRDVLTSLARSQSGARPGDAIPMPAAATADPTGSMDETAPPRQRSAPESDAFAVDAESAEGQLDVDRRRDQAASSGWSTSLAAAGGRAEAQGPQRTVASAKLAFFSPPPLSGGGSSYGHQNLDAT